MPSINKQVWSSLNVEQIKFIDEIVSLEVSNLQSFKKYLRVTLVFMRNSALREKLSFFFSRDFC